MEDKKFKPFIPAEKVMPEFTIFSVILGIILAVVFGGANAYLGLLTWFVIMPMIVLFGSDLVIFPAEVSVAELWATGGTWGIWDAFVRYIGAGALVAGGFISLIKSLPTIVTTFKAAFKSYGKGGGSSSLRTEQDISTPIILGTCLIVALFIWLYPGIPVNPLGAVIVLVFGVFFSTVASRIVGSIGSSNTPVSGMTIATVMVTAIILKGTGTVGTEGMVAAIAIGSVICVIVAYAILLFTLFSFAVRGAKKK